MPIVSHARLVEIAGRWLKTHHKCAVVATELVTTAREIPDAIGWAQGGQMSILVECKTSASDFARDKHKAVKCEARAGLLKYYLTPPGLLDNPAEQLPPGWGLAETDGSNLVSIAHPATPITRNRRNEIAMLYSVILRAHGKSSAPRAATIKVSSDATPTPPIAPDDPAAIYARAAARPAGPLDPPTDTPADADDPD